MEGVLEGVRVRGLGASCLVALGGSLGGLMFGRHGRACGGILWAFFRLCGVTACVQMGTCVYGSGHVHACRSGCVEVLVCTGGVDRLLWVRPRLVEWSCGATCLPDFDFAPHLQGDSEQRCRDQRWSAPDC